jgi:hypothetical protein
VFYTQDEKRSYQRHQVYVVIAFASGLALFAYFAVEMVLVPFSLAERVGTVRPPGKALNFYSCALPMIHLTTAG